MLDQNLTYTLSELLKTNREQKGYSIAKMSELLKVPVKKLNDLEAGEFHKFHESFLKGLIRSYAKKLNIDNDVDLLFKQIWPAKHYISTVENNTSSNSNSHSNSADKQANQQFKDKKSSYKKPLLLLLLLPLLALLGLATYFSYPYITNNLNNQINLNKKNQHSQAYSDKIISPTITTNNSSNNILNNISNNPINNQNIASEIISTMASEPVAQPASEPASNPVTENIKNTSDLITQIQTPQTQQVAENGDAPEGIKITSSTAKENAQFELYKHDIKHASQTWLEIIALDKTQTTQKAQIKKGQNIFFGTLDKNQNIEMPSKQEYYIKVGNLSALKSIVIAGKTIDLKPYTKKNSNTARLTLRIE